MIDDQRRLWHQHFLLGLVGFDGHADKLSVDQRAIRIGYGRAHQDRIRRLVDRHIDEVDLPGLVVGRAIGKADPDGQRLLPLRRSSCCWTLRNSRWLTGNVTYIGSRLTIVVSGPVSGPTTLPLVRLERPTSPVIGEMITVYPRLTVAVFRLASAMTTWPCAAFSAATRSSSMRARGRLS